MQFQRQGSARRNGAGNNDQAWGCGQPICLSSSYRRTKELDTQKRAVLAHFRHYCSAASSFLLGVRALSPIYSRLSWYSDSLLLYCRQVCSSCLFFYLRRKISRCVTENLEP